MNTPDDTSPSPDTTKRLLNDSDIQHALLTLARCVKEGAKGLEDFGWSHREASKAVKGNFVYRIDQFVNLINKSWDYIKSLISKSDDL